MRSTFGLEELKQAQNDFNKLSDLINESDGYVLSKMKKASLMPAKNVILSCVSATSLAFILDHYELTQKERLSLSRFFKDEMGSKKLTKPMNEVDIKTALEDGLRLRHDALLSFDHLTLYHQCLDKQFEIAEYETTEIIVNSLLSLSVEELMKLDESFWAKNHFLISRLKVHMTDEPFRLFAKDIILKKCKEIGRKPNIIDFDFWSFKKEDDLFLKELLSNTDFKRTRWEFSVVTEIDGVDKLIDAWEFYRDYDKTNALFLDKDQVIKHKDELSQDLLDYIQSDRWNVISKLTGYSIAPDFFSLIFGVEQAKVVLEKTSFNFNVISDESDAGKFRFRHILKEMAKLGLDDPSLLLKSAGSSGVAEMCSLLCSRTLDDYKESVILAKELALKVMPIILNSNEDFLFSTIYHDGKVFFQKELIEDLCSFLLENPSVNGLAMLLSVWSQSQENHQGYSDCLNKSCKILGDKLDYESVQNLYQSFGFKWTSPNRFEIQGDFAFNFLKANYKNWSEFSPEMRDLLRERDFNFCENFRKNKVTPLEDDVLHLLRSNDEESWKLLDVLVHHYAKELNNFEHFKREAMIHPQGSRALAFNPNLMSKNKSSDALIQLAKEFDKSLEDLSKVSLEEAERKKWKFSEKAVELGNDIPYSEAKNLIDKALTENNFSLFYLVMEGLNSRELCRESFADKVSKASFEDMMFWVDNSKAFRILIGDVVNYQSKSSIALDFMNDKNNADFAAKLLKIYEKRPTDSLRLFKEDALQGFVHEFVLEYMPRKLVNSYDLKPACGSRATSDKYRLILKPFSDVQLLKLWDGLEEKEGFLRNDDINARSYEFFAANFKDNELGYLSFLEKAKTRPKLYAVLCSSHIFNEWVEAPFSDDDAERKSLYETRAMRYASKHIDWQVAIEGVGLLLDEVKESNDQEDCSRSLILGAVNQVLWLTYASWENFQNGARYYESVLTEEESLLFMKVLCEKAPLLLLSTNKFGIYESVASSFGPLTQSLLNDQSALGMFMPWDAHNNRDYHYGKIDEENKAKMLISVIGWMISNDKSDLLSQLDWMVKQKEFFEEELSYKLGNDFAKETNKPYRRDMQFLSLLTEHEELKKVFEVALERLELQETLNSNTVRKKRSLRM